MLYAPGTRLLIRDEEWLVRKVDPTQSGGYALTVSGLSELVRDREVVFLSELHQPDDIEVLRPEDTRFVADDSPKFLRSRLHLEGRLRQMQPTGEPGHSKLMIGNRAAMDVLPYQLEPALQALDQPRPRILIADAVGLGKTLEAGILLSELIARGRGKRILVCAVKSMLTQFQQELWNRFAIPLVRLDSDGLMRLKGRIPTNANPFHYYDKAIISIDTLKQDRAYRTYLEKAYWDVIVIDEAHHVAERSSRKGGFTGKTASLRNKLAGLLARRSDALVLLSATPHDGRAESFASLMTMLDPTAIANPSDYTKEDIQGLFVRRFKENVEDQLKTAFQSRQVEQIEAQATGAEESAFDALLAVPVTDGTKRGTGQMLFRTVLEKALFSSPQACLATVQKRLAKTENAAEVPALEALAARLEAIGPDHFAKFTALVDQIQKAGWTGADPDDRLVIFTERIETMKFLAEHLPRRIGLTDRQVVTLDGRMRDKELMEKVTAFTQRDAAVRLMIASDVAAEGLNLHHRCHRLIHFDVPWSLMLFQQRNGRIDRYGQTKHPKIHYLTTLSANDKIRGDVRILKVLIEKDQQAQKNIGDPAALMNLYDVDAEVARTAEAMEQGIKAEEFLSKPEADDWLAALLDEAGTQGTVVDPKQRIAPTLSLFPSDFDYVTTGLDYLKAAKQKIDFRVDGGTKTVSLNPSSDLRWRLDRGPREVNPGPGELRLTADKDTLLRSVEAARAASELGGWPEVQFLWPLHPVLGWLDDKVAATFERQQAPVIIQPKGLAADEVAMVILGVIPNRKSHPVIQSWLAVRIKPGKSPVVESFEALADRLGLRQQDWVNPGTAIGDARMAQLATSLPQALKAARRAMHEQREAFHAVVDPELQSHLAHLAKLRGKQEAFQQLRIEGMGGAESRRQDRLEQERRRINEHFTEFETWIRDTMTTEDQPHLQVMAAFVPAS